MRLTIFCSLLLSSVCYAQPILYRDSIELFEREWTYGAVRTPTGAFVAAHTASPNSNPSSNLGDGITHAEVNIITVNNDEISAVAVADAYSDPDCHLVEGYVISWGMAYSDDVNACMVRASGRSRVVDRVLTFIPEGGEFAAIHYEIVFVLSGIRPEEAWTIPVTAGVDGTELTANYVANSFGGEWQITGYLRRLDDNFPDRVKFVTDTIDDRLVNVGNNIPMEVSYHVWVHQAQFSHHTRYVKINDNQLWMGKHHTIRVTNGVRTSSPIIKARIERVEEDDLIY